MNFPPQLKKKMLIFICLFLPPQAKFGQISFTTPDGYRYRGAVAAAHRPKGEAGRRLFLFNLTHQTGPGRYI